MRNALHQLPCLAQTRAARVHRVQRENPASWVVDARFAPPHDGAVQPVPPERPVLASRIGSRHEDRGCQTMAPKNGPSNLGKVAACIVESDEDGAARQRTSAREGVT